VPGRLARAWRGAPGRRGLPGDLPLPRPPRPSPLVGLLALPASSELPALVFAAPLASPETAFPAAVRLLPGSWLMRSWPLGICVLGEQRPAMLVMVSRDDIPT